MKNSHRTDEPIIDPMALDDLANDAAAEIVVEGDEASPGSTPSGPPKRRGRKPRAASQAAAGPNPKGIEATLQLVHGVLGMWVEEMVLSPPEAEQLSQAIANVARHYPNFIASQKTMDIITLAACGGMIYLPRFKLAADRIKRKKSATVSKM